VTSLRPARIFGKAFARADEFRSLGKHFSSQGEQEY
jgi:hypothetical protein